MQNPIHEQQDLIATNYVGFASYIFLVYDHLLTFSDEVNYVWKGRRGPIIYLFLLNRYFFPLAFLVNLYAYLSLEFSHEACQHFVRYEGATVVVGFGLAGLMMIIRVNALYGGDCRPVQAILVFFWIVQVVLYSWILSMGIPVPRTPGIHGCSLIFNTQRRDWASLSAAAPLIFDTAVIVLILFKTAGARRNCMSSMLLKTLMSDGVLYYSVVFTANLALTIMIVVAPPGLKNILGQYAQLITVTMMSRITLHLRKIGARSSVVYSDRPPSGVNAFSVGDEVNSGSSLVAPAVSTGASSAEAGLGNECTVDSTMYAPQVANRPQSGIGCPGVELNLTLDEEPCIAGPSSRRNEWGETGQEREGDTQV
ncbi:hypothetical protein DFH11DRAFT_902663 [Phellopilus nigrolimitatus]|nr:hypothetical protein DFH11DRAFT_902663 [Phellopilus nigrolimitatus]